MWRSTYENFHNFQYLQLCNLYYLFMTWAESTNFQTREFELQFILCQPFNFRLYNLNIGKPIRAKLNTKEEICLFQQMQAIVASVFMPLRGVVKCYSSWCLVTVTSAGLCRWRWCTSAGTGAPPRCSATCSTRSRYCTVLCCTVLYCAVLCPLQTVFVVISSLSISAIAVDRCIVICCTTIHNWSTRYIGALGWDTYNHS